MGFCSKCGAELLFDSDYCKNCEADNSQFTDITALSSTYSENTTNCKEIYNTNGLSEYYIEEFEKITNTNEIYKGKWNWAAFFFGGWWALSKGLWLPFLICLIGSIFTGGLFGLIYGLIFPIRGNYMYYMHVVKGKYIPF